MFAKLVDYHALENPCLVCFPYVRTEYCLRNEGFLDKENFWVGERQEGDLAERFQGLVEE